MTVEKRARVAIERLQELIDASQHWLDSNPTEVQTAEVMRQDQQTFRDIQELLRWHVLGVKEN